MRLVFVIAACFSPAVIAAVYACRKKLSPFKLIAAFFFALAAVITASVLQALYVTWISLPESLPLAIMNKSFITSGFIEEIVKLSVIFMLVHKLAYRSAVDTVEKKAHSVVCSNLYILALFFGLCFGGFETISYTLRYPESLPMRIISAIILHGALAVFFVPLGDRKKKSQIFNFFRAVVLHGLYNMFFLLGGWFVLPAFAVLVCTVLHTLNQFKDAPRC